MILQSKDLLGIKELTPEEICLILDTAENMKRVLDSGIKKTSHMQGKSVITLFYENSTRTRLSFEMASKFMGAASANIASSGSSINKGETLLDTALTIDAMATDILIIRHPQSGAPHWIAPQLKSSVVNAGDGMNEHPTQALLDIFTIREVKKSFDNIKVAIIGDIMHSRVARSNIYALQKLGAQVYLYGPGTLIPREMSDSGIRLCKNIQEACEGSDVLIGLRLQLERQKKSLFPSINEYATFYGINRDLVSLAKKDVMILHPGPCNHGVEMTTEIIESDQSFIHQQVTNGVAVRMAILYLLMTRRNAG
jgi:aspartate carbamoyltransferase catalytic subunit